MTFETPTRRTVLAGMAAVTLAAILPFRPALALTADQARALIDRAVNEINSIINSGASQSRMFSQFEQIFRRYADTSTIARSVLGPPARSLSGSEMSRFTDAFTGYVARKYGKRFREFIGGEIRVTGARPVKSFHEVKAVATLRGQPPFDVSFMVSDRSGKDLFFDLLIEGISLLKAERAEIAALLDRQRGDVAALTKQLQTLG